jgi:hypothetical protein
MDKKLVSLLGAVATLATMDAVQAAPDPTRGPAEVLKASSFNDLLKPIPNAARLLKAIDESGPAKPAEVASDVQVAQFVYPYYHHHHHHHHHHHYGYGVRVIPPGIPVPGRYYHHHHHHHHHHYRYYEEY